MKCTTLFLLLSMALLAQGGFRGAGRYELFSPLSRKVLDMDRNDRRTIIQYESRQTDNQAWDITDAGGGYFYIRNGMNGNALSVQDDRNSSPLVAAAFNSSPAQQWKFESGNDSTAILINRNGKAIDIPYGSTDNGVKINAYGRNGEVNQRWQFQPVSGYSGNRYETSDATTRRGGGGRYSASSTQGRGGVNRYDTAVANSGQRDADGVYFDNVDQMYKMDGDGVCFYRDRDFRGEAVCATLRNGRARWNSALVDTGSVKFFGRATAVQIFDKEQFRGNSVEITGDERNFSRATRGLRGTPQSLRVY